MGLFGTKNKSQSNSAVGNYREPIQGNRKISWDRAAHSRRPSDLDFDLRRTPLASDLSTDVTRIQDHSHIRQISDTGVISSGRRQSHSTDTTSRVRDSQARMIRVRKSDVFSSRPKLHFKSGPQFVTMPDGHLPTLRGQPKSAFIDQLADELNTHQLRDALDTDSRRRRRRQSARESRRLQGSNATTQSPRAITKSSVPSLVAPKRSMSSEHHRINPSNTTTEDVETIVTPPVTSASHRPQPIMLVTESPNAIPGNSAAWQDGDSFIHADPLNKVVPREPEVLLAGNRQSFPDFAVVDRQDLIRPNSGSGFLTTAWSSLWRRASTARTKKENDVAQHRTRTLEKVNNNHVADIPSARQTLPANIERQSENGTAHERPMSASSSVLYETFDDLASQGGTPVVAYPAQHSLIHGALGEEIPTDAFYDPSTGPPRPATRATHSRNFSRPTNDSSQGRYSRMSTQHPGISAIPDGLDKPYFSPLLDGGAFPRPERRIEPNSRVDLQPVNTSHMPSDQSSEAHSPMESFSTSALAAAIRPADRPTNSPPQSSATTDDSTTLSQKPLNHTSTMATPPATADSIMPSSPKSTRSLHSLQSLDSEGSWLVSHRADIDDVVRRSFSRNSKNSRVSSNAMRSPLKRPVSAGSTLRTVIMSDDSDTEPAIMQTLGQATEDSEDDEHLTSSTDRDFEDDSEYEQGIWRTGIGKTVQVVASPLRAGNGPIVIDRSQLGHSVNGSRRNSDDDTRKAANGNVANYTREPVNKPARPSQIMQHESYMTSMNSFYTARATQSATSSRTTLTETDR